MRLGTAATIQTFGAQESVTHAMAAAIKFANSADVMNQPLRSTTTAKLSAKTVFPNGLSQETRVKGTTHDRF